MTDNITLPRATVQQVLGAIDLYQRNEHCEDELLIAGHFLRTALEQPAEPSQWRDMVVVTLVREGVNKHKARELADHFAAPPQQQADPDRWVIEKIGDKLLLNCKEIDPGTIEVRLDGLTYRSSEKMEVRQQAERWCMKANGCKTECGNCPNFTQPEQQAEPVAWMTHSHDLLPLFHRTERAALVWGAEPTPLYTASPQRKPLTEEEIGNLLPDDNTPMSLGEAFLKFARLIEAAHGIKEGT